MARSPPAPPRRAKGTSAPTPQGAPYFTGVLLLAACLVAGYLAGQPSRESLAAALPEQQAPRQAQARMSVPAFCGMSGSTRTSRMSPART